MKFEVPQAPADKPGGGGGGEELGKLADNILRRGGKLFGESFAAVVEQSANKRFTTPDERTFILIFDLRRRQEHFTVLSEEIANILPRITDDPASQRRIRALSTLDNSIKIEVHDLKKLSLVAHSAWRLRSGLQQIIGKTSGDPRFNAYLRSMGETEFADESVRMREITSNDTLDVQRQAKPILQQALSEVVIQDNTSPFIKEVAEQLRAYVEALGTLSGAA